MSTIGLGPICFESVISDLPSLVRRVKSGAVSSSLGPGWSEPISCRNNPRISIALLGRSPRDMLRAGAGKAASRSDRERKPAPSESAARKNVSSSSRVSLPLPSRSSLENTNAPGGGGESLLEKSKSACVSAPSRSRSSRAKSASRPGNSLRAIRLSPSRSKRLRVASQSKRVWVTAVRNQPYFGPMASSSRIAVYMSSHSGRSGQASWSTFEISSASPPAGAPVGVAGGLGSSAAASRATASPVNNTAKIVVRRSRADIKETPRGTRGEEPRRERRDIALKDTGGRRRNGITLRSWPSRPRQPMKGGQDAGLRLLTCAPVARLNSPQDRASSEHSRVSGRQDVAQVT